MVEKSQSGSYKHLQEGTQTQVGKETIIWSSEEQSPSPTWTWKWAHWAPYSVNSYLGPKTYTAKSGTTDFNVALDCQRSYPEVHSSQQKLVTGRLLPAPLHSYF